MARPFKGVIKLDVRDSKPDWTPYELKKAPVGAPNILIVLYDDTGLAAWSPFGGRIDMPTLQKLADNGLRYSQWQDRKSTRLNSSHLVISYAVFCLKKKKTKRTI